MPLTRNALCAVRDRQTDQRLNVEGDWQDTNTGPRAAHLRPTGDVDDLVDVGLVEQRRAHVPTQTGIIPPAAGVPKPTADRVDRLTGLTGSIRTAGCRRRK